MVFPFVVVVLGVVWVIIAKGLHKASIASVVVAVVPRHCYLARWWSTRHFGYLCAGGGSYWSPLFKYSPAGQR